MRQLGKFEQIIYIKVKMHSNCTYMTITRIVLVVTLLYAYTNIMRQRPGTNKSGVMKRSKCDMPQMSFPDPSRRTWSFCCRCTRVHCHTQHTWNVTSTTLRHQQRTTKYRTISHIRECIHMCSRTPTNTGDIQFYTALNYLRHNVNLYVILTGPTS